MEGVVKCNNKLVISADITMEVKNNIPTSELLILKELSNNIRQTVIKYKGSMLSVPEWGDRAYLILISTMAIRTACIDSKMTVVDIADIPSFIKRILSN